MIGLESSSNPFFNARGGAILYNIKKVLTVFGQYFCFKLYN